MRVETVWFTHGIRIKMPSGSAKSVTALSTLNKWEHSAIRMEVVPALRCLMIRHILPPCYEMLVPFEQIKFMHLDDSVRERVDGPPRAEPGKPRRRVVNPA